MIGDGWLVLFLFLFSSGIAKSGPVTETTLFLEECFSSKECIGTEIASY